MSRNYVNRLKGLSIILLCLLTFSAYSQKNKVKNTKPNILFIAVDDLKPILGCYGNTIIKTPNIDRIAAQGTVFLNNYCQQAVCGPTRASLMTGMRPDKTKVWDLRTQMREVCPELTPIPEYLINNGYTTSAIGKIYHPGCIDKEHDKKSWSVPYLDEFEYIANGYGLPALKHYQKPETKALVEKYTKEATDKGLKAGKVTDYVYQFIKPSVECIDAPDNAYSDGAMALKAKDQMIALLKNNKPFFMGVGFHKPHLPFVSPKKYWDMYNRDDMPLAKFQEHAKNSPVIAYTRAGELKNYTDIPALCTFTDQSLNTGLAIEKQKELIHGYYAAVSYMDAQVGILLNTLDSLGILNNTIIVLWGDHGWHLGDHDLWCKHTNFENATRAPLIISGPGIKPGKSNSMTEFIDIYPTLCDLSGIPIPKKLDGKSLVPIMKDNKKSVKDYAVSQYPRSLKKKDVEKERLESGDLMGYSIRTERYRYTVWMNNNYRSNEQYSKARVYATELYDYEKDPLETVNVSAEKEYETVAKEMNDKMLAYFKSQEIAGSNSAPVKKGKENKNEQVEE